MRTNWKRAMTVGTASSLVILGMVSPAQAGSHTHDKSWGTGSVLNLHRAVNVCDKDANGRGLRIEYTFSENGTIHHLGDSDGANGLCKSATTSEAIHKFRIVESNTGGGGEKYTGWENIVGR
jgi:hypothetical protein